MGADLFINLNLSSVKMPRSRSAFLLRYSMCLASDNNNHRHMISYIRTHRMTPNMAYLDTFIIFSPLKLGGNGCSPPCTPELVIDFCSPHELNRVTQAKPNQIFTVLTQRLIMCLIRYASSLTKIAKSKLHPITV